MTSRLSPDMFIVSPGFLVETRHNRLLSGHLVDQCHHVFRQQVVGLACQVDAQPIAYFLANGGTTLSLDLTIIPNNWTGHERFPVCLSRFRRRPALDSK
jgi:hypothetical protein